jgi:hypothetical protein
VTAHSFGDVSGCGVIWSASLGTYSAMTTLPAMQRKHATQPTKLKRSLRNIFDRMASERISEAPRLDASRLPWWSYL